jgi:hypothetical protein
MTDTGYVTAIIGLAGTVVGALLGGGLTYAVGEAQRKRRTADEALVSVDLALRDCQPEDISVDHAWDLSYAIDRGAERLGELRAAPSIAAARRSLAALRVRYPSGPVHRLSVDLDRDLSVLRERVAAWYAVRVAHAVATPEVERALDQAFTESVRRHEAATQRLGRLRQELGRVSLGDLPS